MSAVQELYVLTKELYEISTDEQEKDTDQKISMISRILDIREKLLSNINLHSLQDEEKTYVYKVIEMDKEINESCKTILIEIQQKLRSTTKAKSTQKKYINPYSQIHQASRFFDKKK